MEIIIHPCSKSVLKSGFNFPRSRACKRNATEDHVGNNTKNLPVPLRPEKPRDPAKEALKTAMYIASLKGKHYRKTKQW